MSKEYRLQTKASDLLILMLKLHAIKRRKRLFDVYVDAFGHLLRERATFLRNGRSVQYLFAPHEGRTLYVRIPRALAKAVASAAREDGVPLSAIAHTAFYGYELSHVFPIPKPRCSGGARVHDA